MKIIISINTTSIKDINQITLYADGAIINYEELDNIKFLFETILDNEFDEEIFVDEVIEDFNRCTGDVRYNLMLALHLSNLYKHFVDLFKANISNYTQYKYKVLRVVDSAILLEYDKLEDTHENYIAYTKPI